MKKEEIINYKIDSNILKSYVDVINTIKDPMSQIKKYLNQITKTMPEQIKNINTMSNAVKALLIKYPNEQAKIFMDIIKQLMNANNGMLSTRMIEPLNISRQYLSVMERNNDIERISRGIYLAPSAFEDSYFLFQQKYKKAIFSHMNALYFYGMTEEFPYNFTVTVPQRYHVNTVNDKCDVFYVSDDIYEIGIIEVETPGGNKVRAYDIERCICDIIRSKNRMDFEQVKFSIREYIKRKDKDLIKLSRYAGILGIREEVMDFISMLYE